MYFYELVPSDITAFLNEAQVLASLKHDNVVKLHGVCVAPPSLCLVLDLCEGNLRELIAANNSAPATLNSSLDHPRRCLPRTPEAFVAAAIQCVTAVHYLHSRPTPILHRDIKSLNFLVSHQQTPVSDPRVVRETMRDSSLSNSLSRSLRASWKLTVRFSNQAAAVMSTEALELLQDAGVPLLKLSDMGLCSEEKSANIRDFTLRWAAPEILAGEPYTAASDLFSLSVVRQILIRT
jgi:serine/threonine protein kinase